MAAESRISKTLALLCGLGTLTAVFFTFSQGLVGCGGAKDTTPLSVQIGLPTPGLPYSGSKPAGANETPRIYVEVFDAAETHLTTIDATPFALFQGTKYGNALPALYPYHGGAPAFASFTVDVPNGDNLRIHVVGFFRNPSLTTGDGKVHTWSTVQPVITSLKGEAVGLSATLYSTASSGCNGISVAFPCSGSGGYSAVPVENYLKFSFTYGGGLLDCDALYYTYLLFPLRVTFRDAKTNFTFPALTFSSYFDCAAPYIFGTDRVGLNYYYLPGSATPYPGKRPILAMAETNCSYVTGYQYSPMLTSSPYYENTIALNGLNCPAMP